ncbi:cytochrome c biogenesis protein ResB [Allopusillimonas ginsengisoli]|uniref:cytochrome c biogenesis protein ResB n=1 Tax=Allopusillimonas ginsengisoli TaxID=453575 RepID=UPI00101F5A8F|nr:cytochrome c biogenesis protein ResB [Allopusillimonas ginsengisoli]TEA76849.1 cytochrome c biogenesis protein ResB [Allopusillimonas ginsengisoli]
MKPSSVSQSSSARRHTADLMELLGSMRFAVSLLMFICVASVIGTVLQQNQPANNYIDQFGPFWFSVFDKFSIWQIYNSWWFLLIMAFLVVSTSICLVRNAPKMVRDAQSFREYVRASSLRSFHHRVELSSAASSDAMQERAQAWLKRHGYRYKVREEEAGVMIAAKKGSANRLGYIFAHAAIVIICIGGLLDSELPVRLQVWLGGKQPITQNMLISEVPESGRLSGANPSFRANMLVPEGSQSSSGIVAIGEGVLVQPLPFSLKLNRFLVDYYSTGMPSSFKSEVEVTDPVSGESFNQTIEVNEPLRYKGVTVYQSSFDDGGSAVHLTGYPLVGPRSKAFDVEGTIGEGAEITQGSEETRQPLRVEFTGLRVINVENMGSDLEPQPKAMFEHVASVTGSAAGVKNENLRNVGPSIQYRITGADGQSHEYTSYMLPMQLDGGMVFLAGVRESEAQPFRYLRIPADANNSVQEFMLLRAGLADPALVNLAAQRFAERNATSDIQQPLLEKASLGALETFRKSGFNGIIERVPEQDREKVLGFAVPMIQLSLAELRDIVRERNGIPAVQHVGEDGVEAEKWIQTALLALANVPDYPAPVLMTLKSFDQVEASVFQVARSPGKNTVYLGCLLLVIGVFSMFYIRDRRIWVWIKKQEGGSALFAAMTSQRRTLDFNHEFDRFKEAFTRLAT